MDTIILTWQFVFFSLSIAAVMFVVKKTAEYLMSRSSSLPNKDSKIWTDLLLPVLPIVIGALAGLLFKKFPYPDGLTTTSSRIIFGLVAGLLSTLVYRVAKSFLFQKIMPTKNVGDEENVVVTAVTSANDSTVATPITVAPATPVVVVSTVVPAVTTPADPSTNKV